MVAPGTDPLRVAVVGVASSAGSHHAGQDRAPAALRAAGLVDRLRAAGLGVDDRGDVVEEVFVPDSIDSTARNLDTVVRVAETVRDEVESVVAAGALPLVLGGDCTITLGVVAGVQRHDLDMGLVYFDGDVDLSTPATTDSGVLDAMGVAHLLGLADTGLTGLGPTSPMLSDERLVLLGYDESDLSAGAASLVEHPDLLRFPAQAVRADPVGCAHAARQALEPHTNGLVVHFDVDAVDSRDLPLANFPHYGTGVPLDVAADALAYLCAAPTLSAVVLTEVNPSYDPSGRSLTRYVDAVAGALIAGLTGRSPDTRSDD